MKRLMVRVRPQCVFGVLVCLATLSGCEALIVRTEPPGAKIIVRNPKGDIVVENVPSPVKVPFGDSQGEAPWRIQAQEEGYEPAEEVLTPERYAALPREDGARVLEIKLEKVRVLRIETQPPGAMVEVTALDGRRCGRGASPLEVPLSFAQSGARYRVKITMENYEPYETEIGLTELLSLEEIRDRTYLLNAVLQPLPYKPDVEARVRFRPAKGFEIVYWPVRAFAEGRDPPGRTLEEIFQLPAGAAIRGLHVSPDGQWVVFSLAIPRKAAVPPGELTQKVSQTLPVYELESANIYKVSLDPRQRGLTNVTLGPTRDLDPCVSWDGVEIYFISDRIRHPRTDILVIRENEPGVFGLFFQPPSASVLSPSISRDGTLAFAYYGDNEPTVQIWLKKVRGGFATRVEHGYMPCISPDGRKIAFIGNDKNLWVVDTNGTNRKRLTSDAAAIQKNYESSLTPQEREWYQPELLMPYAYPRWTPDSRYIVVSAMRNTGNINNNQRPNGDIWLFAADGSNERNLTSNASVDTQPCVTPDGRRIVFVSNRGGRWRIWSMDAPQFLWLDGEAAQGAIQPTGARSEAKPVPATGGDGARDR